MWLSASAFFFQYYRYGRLVSPCRQGADGYFLGCIDLHQLHAGALNCCPASVIVMSIRVHHKCTTVSRIDMGLQRVSLHAAILPAAFRVT